MSLAVYVPHIHPALFVKENRVSTAVRHDAEERVGRRGKREVGERGEGERKERGEGERKERECVRQTN